MMAGQSAEAQARLREANALALEVDDDAVQLGVALDNAQPAFWAGRLRAALVHIDDALRRLERGVPQGSAISVGLTGQAFALAMRGLCLSVMGRAREGAADLERALHLEDARGSLEGRCVGHQFRSLAALVNGDLRIAVPHAQAAMELAARAGNPFLERLAQANLGCAYTLSGRTRDGICMLEALTGDVGGTPSIGFVEWLVLPVLADAYRAEGRLDTACATAVRAVELARANDALTTECNAQLALASALAQARGAAARPAIEAALARAHALIEESGAESARPRLHLVRAACARVLADNDAVRRELRAAQRLWRGRWRSSSAFRGGGVRLSIAERVAQRLHPLRRTLHDLLWFDQGCRPREAPAARLLGIWHGFSEPAGAGGERGAAARGARPSATRCSPRYDRRSPRLIRSAQR